MLLALFTLALVLLLNRAYVVQVAHEGAGFAAKYLCSGVFISGYPPETMLQQAVAPANPLLRWVSYSVDREQQSVTASLFGLAHRSAHYRPRLGCTLYPAEPSAAIRQVLQQQAPEHFAERPAKPGALRPPQGQLASAMAEAFAENDSRGPKHTKAIVVLHRGKRVAEHYAPGIKPDTPLMGWSMSKSVTNALVGILVQQGRLSLEQPAPIGEWTHDIRREITLEHLLRMNSGLAFQEKYDRNSDVARMLTFESRMGDFAAAKPLAHPVGTHWSYSSGTSNILARIVFEQNGADLASTWRFMHEQLFYPLGIFSAHFEPDASGIFVGSSYLHMSARGWARIGQLFLQDGIWQGQRLLPEGWTDFSRSLTTTAPNTRFGAHFWLNLTPEKTGAPQRWPDLPEDTYAMEGYQGQRVFIIPSKQLVVARLGLTPEPAKAGSNLWLRAIIDALEMPQASND